METKDLDAISESVRAFTKTTSETLAETSARLLAVEQKMATRNESGGGGETKSIGEILVKSDGFQSLMRGARNTGQIEIGTFHAKTALVNATGQNQPLVQDYRVPGVVFPGQQRLTIRDLLPSYPVSSNLVQFSREASFTNAAAMQTGGSPNSGENVAKAESAATFDLTNAAVQTLAHWIPASRQLMDDAPAFQAYINSRLTYFLKLTEERELLLGDGTGNHLSGLVANSTAFDTAVSSTSDTYIDVIQRAITQVEDGSNLPADAVILNNLDWAQIQLIKTTGTASSGEYIYSNPHQATLPSIWGLPVVATKSMPRNQGLVGNFGMGAAIWDRNNATVEVSREHSDFFVKNMVAILCEERLTMTVFRPLAFVYFGFPFGS